MLVRLVVLVALIVVATLTASLAMADDAARGATCDLSRQELAQRADERLIAPCASIAR